MEAIIRTQDRKMLTLCRNEFAIRNKGYFSNEKDYCHLIGIDFNGKDTILGRFENEKTAIKELDRIHDAIEYYMMYEKGKIPFVEINEDYDVE